MNANNDNKNKQENEIETSLLPHLLLSRGAAAIHTSNPKRGQFIQIFLKIFHRNHQFLEHVIPEFQIDQLFKIFEGWEKYVLPKTNESEDSRNRREPFDHVGHCKTFLESPGDYVPIICHAQNALISIRVPKTKQAGYFPLLPPPPPPQINFAPRL